MRHVAEGTTSRWRRGSTTVESATGESAAQAGRSHAGANWLRTLAESLICLLLAVTVFRTFLLEGYMISTGSMAPTLLGFHKQIECPACGYAFAFGTGWQDEPLSVEGGPETPAGGPFCRCPNCGKSGIETGHLPRNQGDQLLVYKGAFALRPVRRWEIGVFRNPYKTTQAYVKRVVGLPGEELTVRHGDAYADGKLCRKDWEQQRAMRINVHDHDFAPTDEDWQPRWTVASNGWRTFGSRFVSAPSAAKGWHWVQYRHWIRGGGRHLTSVAVDVPDDVELQVDPRLPIQFDAKTNRFSCRGVMTVADRDLLLAAPVSPEVRAAIEELAAASHFAPITDDYGYNLDYAANTTATVRDLMLVLDVSFPKKGEDGQFVMELEDEAATYRLVITPRERLVQLFSNAEPQLEPVRSAQIPAKWFEEWLHIEFSIFDRQVAAAVNGTKAFEHFLLPETPADGDPSSSPARFGTKGLTSVQVSGLKLYRDVYYTRREEDQPCQLGENEFFVLGDNSPVSLDSRRWANGAVPATLFLGKPVLVHLPSKQVEIRFSDWEKHVRVPDFSRIRYIR